MVGKTGSRLIVSQLDLNEIRYLRLKGQSMDEIGGRLSVCRQTISRLIQKNDLGRDLSEAEYVHCDVLHHFRLNSGRLDDPSLSAGEYVRISGIHARQAGLLMRNLRGKSQMADEKPRRQFEDLSDDELRAVLVRLGLAVETKSERRRNTKIMHAENCTCPFHGAGETLSKTSAD